MPRNLLSLLLGFALALPALADTVQVDSPWVRATAPGQKVAAGFMTLTSDADMTLVGGASPVCNSIELHFMRMEKGVMEMRQMPEIALPKGKAVSLEPGGLHVMFIGLKEQIKAGAKVPLSLKVKGADGKEQQIEVQAEVMRMGGMRRH